MSRYDNPPEYDGELRPVTARRETFTPHYGNSAVDLMRDEATRENHRVGDGHTRVVNWYGGDVTREEWQ